MQSVLRSHRGFIVLGIAFTTAATVLVASTADAQQGGFITAAAVRLEKAVEKSNKKGYKLDDNKFSIGGGWLKQSAEWTSLVNVKLIAGKEYRFLAAGDADATDVDLRLVDPKTGEPIPNAADTGVEPLARVDFQPTKSGNYQVQVRVFASKGNVPCVVLALLMTK